MWPSCVVAAVCVSVCLLITTVRRRVKAAEPIQMPFGAWTRVCPKATTTTTTVAPPEGEGVKGEASPLLVDVQKLCNMCVLSLSWNFFVSHDKYQTLQIPYALQ